MPSVILNNSVRRCLLIVLYLCLGRMVFAGASAGELQGLLALPEVRPGLCVHLDCGDGAATAALAGTGHFLIHGLTVNHAAAEKARATLVEKGVAGRVLIDACKLEHLPYIDNEVDVLLLERMNSLLASGLHWNECARVLAPFGVLFINQEQGLPALTTVKSELARVGITDIQAVANHPGWLRAIKPYPTQTDEWTHFEHDAGRSSVSSDLLAGPPAGIQWLSGGDYPSWRVFYDPSEALVSIRGRNIYWSTNTIYGKGGIAGSRLSARNAYNGFPLWERVLDVPSNPQCLVADGERIFVYLARHRLLVLDAASGKEVATFDNAATCELLLFLQGFLFQYDRGGHLRVLDATTGAIAWEKTFAADYGWETAGDRMVADHNAVYLIYRAEHAGALHLCALELANGHPRWDIVPTDIQMDGKALDTFNLVSCVHDRLVLSNVSRIVKPTKCANFVLSTTDGHVLWSNSYAPTGHGGPATDVLALGEQLWLKTDKAWTAFDLTTGVAGALGTHPQQQCYPDHATPRYILGGQMHFVDTKTSEETLFAATRSGCGSGFLPANGLVYTFPTRCDCYPLLRGYFGLTPVSGLSAEPDDDMSGRLERAPTDTRALVPTTSDDWPTYRHDASRSGSSPTPPPAEPRLRWTLQLGASLTAPTIAGGKVYLAVTDTGEVLALDALTGAKSWSFLTGGAVCTPPTLYGGMALVGCADGWVYSLRAENGTLVWRFRAAPDDRRIVVRGKLESLWPVDNGVLVKDGVAYVVAGRHSYTDNGLFLYALDPLSGKLIWVTRRQRADGSELADMLLIDGNTLYLGGADQFDLKTGKPLDSGAGAMLWAPHTFLGDYSAVSNRGGNDNWRGTWAYTDKKGVRALNIYVGGRYAERTWAARGNLLVDKQGMAYGVIQGAVVKDEPSESALFRQPLGQARSWTTPLPPIGEETVTALLLAGDTLVAGGASTDKEKGRNGKLWLYAADNGALRCAFDLPSVPRWDSLAAAADGTLFLTTETGSLLCVGK